MGFESRQDSVDTFFNRRLTPGLEAKLINAAPSVRKNLKDASIYIRTEGSDKASIFSIETDFPSCPRLKTTYILKHWILDPDFVNKIHPSVWFYLTERIVENLILLSEIRNNNIKANINGIYVTKSDAGSIWEISQCDTVMFDLHKKYIFENLKNFSYMNGGVLGTLAFCLFLVTWPVICLLTHFMSVGVMGVAAYAAIASTLCIAEHLFMATVKTLWDLSDPYRRATYALRPPENEAMELSEVKMKF